MSRGVSWIVDRQASERRGRVDWTCSNANYADGVWEGERVDEGRARKCFIRQHCADSPSSEAQR